MQLPPLPHHIDLWELATHGGRIDGVVALNALPRLAQVLHRTEGEATVALTARMGAQGEGGPFVEGEIRAEIELICQRCLNPLRLLVTAIPKLGLVCSEDEEKVRQLPDYYESLLLEKAPVCIANLVEDELLLALPHIPRHEDLRECQANGYMASNQTVLNLNPHQPFANLASLLQDSCVFEHKE